MKASATTSFQVTQASSGHISVHQLGVVLSGIACDAMVLKGMLSRCADMAPDVDAVNGYCTAMEAIVQRMLWIADTACRGLPGTAGVPTGLGDDLLGLFLPPAFFDGGAA